MLVQMVRLFRAGEPVKMSKRSGNFVTLADVVEEVGKDVVRFIMLTRRSDAQLDFDFANVVEQSKHNPFFYVQYAHSRTCSFKRNIAYAGFDTAPSPELSLPAEYAIMLVTLITQFPCVFETAHTHTTHQPTAIHLADQPTTL